MGGIDSPAPATSLHLLDRDAAHVEGGVGAAAQHGVDRVGRVLRVVEAVLVVDVVVGHAERVAQDQVLEHARVERRVVARLQRQPVALLVEGVHVAHDDPGQVARRLELGVLDRLDLEVLLDRLAEPHLDLARPSGR